MDRSGPLARLLILLSLALLPGAAFDASTLPIREARWVAPNAVYRNLTREPAECFAPPADPAGWRSAAIGRIAFRTPMLLGGQAARAGLSCASCHRNGRGNPDFLFPGLSGEPGTADVTHSLVSRSRGDGQFNPRPIPDLGGPRAALKIDQRRETRALETFIRGLVAEEFDGRDPPSEVLEGLATYVRSLRPQACGRSDERVTLASRLSLVEQAVELAADARGETRRLLLAAARSELGAIDERFSSEGLGAARKVLSEAGRELGSLREGGDLSRWRERWGGRRQILLRFERRSLFNPARLRRAMARAK